jgi:cytochrome o ubiquinol oxidase subunit 2
MKKLNRKHPFVPVGLAGLLVAAFLQGCSHIPLLDPKGPIGVSERFVILTAFGLMLIVVIPVIVMSLWFPRRYRASNTKSPYTPNWCRSGKIDLVVWLVPALIVAALGTLAWTTTHRLDPYKPIASEVKPVTIEVVALDWKWLFIYPDQQIATVNRIVFPVHAPLSFKITSDAVLASFFIPQLGSQLYAMPGKLSRLHLLADEEGSYRGQNQQFSGRGYADMRFEAVAVSQEQFQAWLSKTRQSPDRLDLARFEALHKPSTNSPVQYFSQVEPGLFERILHREGRIMTQKQNADAEGR